VEVNFNITAVETLLESSQDTVELPRHYMGLSHLQESCPRKLWYGLHWYYTETVTPRLKRIFQRGDLEEARVIIDLRKAGMSVAYEQHEIEVNSYIRGHIDGTVVGVPDSPKVEHLLEIKTSNAKGWSALAKAGVEKAKPMHYAQMVLYMHCLVLKRALYVCTNKDDESRYYERVRANPDLATYLLERAKDIAIALKPPEKISDDEDSFACKFCPAREVCHNEATPERNCRTCEHVEKRINGWTCGITQRILTVEEQRTGCKKHSYT
jgi:CRISPR/Cas system-associated exonuclease Cas4 (RecB family)